LPYSLLRLLRSAGQTETVAGSDGNELLAKDVVQTSSSYFLLVEDKRSTPTLCLAYADGYLTLAATLESCLEKETNATTDLSVQSVLETRIARIGRYVRCLGSLVSRAQTLEMSALVTQTAMEPWSAGGHLGCGADARHDATPGARPHVDLDCPRVKYL